MRITTNQIRRNYLNQLNSTLSGLEQSRYQVETGRRFQWSYEDTASAAKGNVLETRYSRNADYISTIKNAQNWQDTQEDALLQLSSMATQIDSEYSVAAMQDTIGDTGRNVYATTLRELQKSMVSVLNSKYGNTYVLAGNDGLNAPFKLSDDGLTLTYRGLDVDDPQNNTALNNLANETSYLDLGFGLSFDNNGQIISSSAFNAALPGISVMGYGKNDAGTSQNMIVLVGQMAECLENEPFDSDKYSELWTQFSESRNKLVDEMSALGTKTQLLESTLSRLEAEQIRIDEQYSDTVGIEASEAITNYSWAQYVYNAALKVGTSILDPSLLDYLS
jgi:flagellar hook-associated protein 3 FlgL